MLVLTDHDGSGTQDHDPAGMGARRGAGSELRGRVGLWPRACRLPRLPDEPVHAYFLRSVRLATCFTDGESQARNASGVVVVFSGAATALICTKARCPDGLSAASRLPGRNPDSGHCRCCCSASPPAWCRVDIDVMMSAQSNGQARWRRPTTLLKTTGFPAGKRRLTGTFLSCMHWRLICSDQGPFAALRQPAPSR